MIGRILELSKFDLREQPAARVSFDPAELLRALLQRFQPLIERKSLQVSTDLLCRTSFNGDREALTTVFLNILDNAFKYAPEKGSIIVRATSKPDRLEISITNTYAKLPEEELAAIFDPFHRVKESGRAGSGLGLAIARKIVEKHGGTIKAYNAERGLEIRMVL